MITVQELISKLQAMPQDANVFADQADSERAYRVGSPYVTTDGDVVIPVGGIFIDGFEEVDDDTPEV